MTDSEGEDQSQIEGNKSDYFGKRITRRKAIGTAAAVGVTAVVAAAVAGTAGYLVAGAGKSAQTVTQTVTSTAQASTVTQSASSSSTQYILAFAADFSDGGSAQDTEDRSFVQLAVDDYNKYMTDNNIPVSFVLKTADHKFTADGALAAVQTLHAAGANAIMIDHTSPMAAAKAYTDQNHILLTSGTATGITLDIPNDSIFRIVPPDADSVLAMAAMIAQQGHKNTVHLCTDDAMTHPLANSLQAQLKQKGVTCDVVVAAVSETDFASDMQSVDSKISAEGATAFSIYTGAGIPATLNQIQHAMQLPNLSAVQWYGADMPSSELVYPPQVDKMYAQFLHDRGMLGFSYPTPNGSKAQSVLARFKAQVGHAAEPLDTYDYDAAWLTMEAVRLTNNNGAMMIQNFPDIADVYNGITGPVALDANGDLLPTELVLQRFKDDLSFPPLDVGTYNAQTDTAVFTGPEPYYDFSTKKVVVPPG